MAHVLAHVRMQRNTAGVLALSLIACHVEPPVDPETSAERERLRIERKMALAEREQAQTKASDATAIRDGLVAEISSIVETEEAVHARRHAIESAVQRYAQAMETAVSLIPSCKRGVTLDAASAALEAYRALAVYTSTPQRDQAIASLEPCRKVLADHQVTLFRETVISLRQDFALDIEERYDEANPYSKGSLVAKVVGSVLQVRMKGTFEGRARYSQEQIDAWCDRTHVFTKIVLRNAHGTFSCTPHVTIEQASKEALDELGLLTSWLTPIPGTEPVPTLAASPPPVADRTAAKAELAARLQLAETTLLAVNKDLGDADTKVNRLTSRLLRHDEEVAADEAAWREGVDATGRKVQIAGVAIAITGGVSIGLGAYSGYARSQTKEALAIAKTLQIPGVPNDSSDELEAKYDRQTLGLTVGIAAGLSLLATGIILAIVGKNRRDSVRIAASHGGVMLRF